MVEGAPTAATTLEFSKFWAWISAHPNCIVRAGTAEVLIFDHDDFHWTLISEGEGMHVVQLARGKELIGEIVVQSQDIAYVQCESGANEEFICECIVETPDARAVAYHFVMAHPYEEREEPSEPRRWTH